MFTRIGPFVARHPWWIIFGWLLLAAGLRWVAPRWDDITYDGDLAYLPASRPSVRGERLLTAAFPENRARSQIVLVMARQDRPLDEADLTFVDQVGDRFARQIDASGWPLVEVWTRHTDVFGDKLRSSDRQAQLAILQLSNEFMAVDNMRVLSEVERLLEQVKSEVPGGVPSGLEIGISGSAAVGGDMLRAAAESMQSTEWLTIVFVLAILLVVYRSPLLVFVPLVTIVVSLSVATSLVAALTQLHHVPGCEWWTFKVFTTTRIFIVVILYGSGTDFCLFLIARFREEMAECGERTEAVGRALRGVSGALWGSALTTIAGLGAMYFAEFGKFSNSGPAIGLCLCVTLAACLTLSPALLAAWGRYVFWPGGDQARASALSERMWSRVADAVLARPGLLLVACLAVMGPLAAYGAWRGNRVTYDLLSELSPERLSRHGAELLREHFPVGEGGPIIVLAHRPGAGFGDKDRAVASEALSQVFDMTVALRELPGVQSVRSLAEPLGNEPKRLSVLSSAGRRKLLLQNHSLTKRIFVGQGPEYAGAVTRFELIMHHDPFSPDAVATLEAVDRKLAEVRAAPNGFWSQAEFVYAGTTAGIRDLREVTHSDQLRIQCLVTLSVLAILWALLRRPVICVLLIGTVLVSYWVTLGLTQVTFAWWYGESFDGLDWKVPTFLFVILVAVGEDYNIYLTTRVFEEQSRLGLADGLRTAMIRTGGIITSCGVIMAGTFVSMISGSLRTMVELGFALSLGILLDTMLVRSILVPAMLALGQRFGQRFGHSGSGSGDHSESRIARRANEAKMNDRGPNDTRSDGRGPNA